MKHYKFIIIFLTIVYLIKSSVVRSSNVMKNTKYLDPVERIFLRKKRFIVFPNYAAVKITVATGKSLIARYPRGVNLSLELSLYYPLPTMLEEWYPKRYRSSTTTTTKKPSKMEKVTSNEMKMKNAVLDLNEPLMVGQYPLHNEGGTIWFEPSNSWNPNVTLSFVNSKDAIKMQNRIWNKNKDYNGKFSGNSYYESMKWNPLKHNPNLWKNSEWNHNQNSANKWFDPKWSNYRQKFQHVNHYKDWKYYRKQRDRRDLYHHLEGLSFIFDVDVKSCIQRSICESKQFLLPQGYSLIQDVLRIIFSFPTIDGMFDDFSQAVRTNENKCESAYHQKCPFSILNFALSPEKINAN